jgi:hypothetical protein
MLRTLRAMMVPVDKCLTLLTVPPLPDPSSFRTSSSSGRKSSLYSMPISSCSSLLASSLPLSASYLFSAVGGGFGAAGVRASPLTFLRFMERGAKSAMANGTRLAATSRWRGTESFADAGFNGRRRRLALARWGAQKRSVAGDVSGRKSEG